MTAHTLMSQVKPKESRTMSVETINYMGEQIDICTGCDYACDNCKCEESEAMPRE